FEDRGREILLVRRVRIVLRLEAETGAVTIDVAALALDRAVEEIARVELQAWLGRRDLHRTPALRIRQSRRELEAGSLPFQHPVVIVALAVLELLIAVLDARADDGRPTEVERRAADVRELTPRNQRVVDGRVEVRVDQELLPEDIPRSLARHVPVRVLSEIDGCRLV